MLPPFVIFLLICLAVLGVYLLYLHHRRRRGRLVSREQRAESHLGELVDLSRSGLRTGANSYRRESADSFRDSFYSCFGDEDELALVAHRPSQRADTLSSLAKFAAGQEAVKPAVPAPPPRKLMRSANNNKVSHYKWLHQVLESILHDKARESVQTLDTREKATPIFLVAGACPNSFCPMQAVLFCKMPKGIDFWWVKPKSTNKNELEENTLHRHVSGPHKNDPGKSKKFYQPIAEKFEGKTDGDFYFGVDEGGRAFVEDLEPSIVPKQRLLVYMMWLESWSSPMSRQRFVQGKLFYEKSEFDSSNGVWRSSSRSELKFYARQYRIEDSRIFIDPAAYEEEIPNTLPPDRFQDMYEMASGN